jgi:hypothetical protein
MTGGGLGQAIGTLIALPFVLVADWLGWIKQQPPGQQELAKACHGVGMLALLVLWFSLVGGFDHFVFMLASQPGNPINWIPAAIAAWGLGWFLINAGFAAQSIGRPHRATMIVRSLVKIGVAYAVWSYANDNPGQYMDGTRNFGIFILDAISLWCASTGITKLLLMLWGGPRGRAQPLVEKDIAAKEFNWDEGRM